MSPSNLSKYVTATLAAVACAFVVSGVRAGELTPGATEANSWYAPCHPALDRGACAKMGLGAVEVSTAGSAILVQSDPVAAPCHPSFDHGACIRSKQASATRS